MEFRIPKVLISELMKKALTNDNPIKGAGQLELLSELLDDKRVIVIE